MIRKLTQFDIIKYSFGPTKVPFKFSVIYYFFNVNILMKKHVFYYNISEWNAISSVTQNTL